MLLGRLLLLPLPAGLLVVLLCLVALCSPGHAILPSPSRGLDTTPNARLTDAFLPKDQDQNGSVNVEFTPSQEAHTWHAARPPRGAMSLVQAEEQVGRFAHAVAAAPLVHATSD